VDSDVISIWNACVQERVSPADLTKLMAGRTLEEVGRQFQVTRERIRQIEAKALRKMRHPTRIRQLEGFLELPRV